MGESVSIVAELYRDLKKAQGDHKAATSHLNSYRRYNAELREQLKEAHSEIDDLAASCADRGRQIDDLVERLSNAAQTITERVTECARLREEVCLNWDRIEALERNLEALRSK